MVQVTVLKDYTFSENGINRKELIQGQTAWIPTFWAEKFVKKGIVQFYSELTPEIKVLPKPKKAK